MSFADPATVDSFIVAMWDEDAMDVDLPNISQDRGRIGVWVPAIDDRDAIRGGQFFPASNGMQLWWGQREAWRTLTDVVQGALAPRDPEPF